MKIPVKILSVLFPSSKLNLSLMFVISLFLFTLKVVHLYFSLISEKYIVSTSKIGKFDKVSAKLITNFSTPFSSLSKDSYIVLPRVELFCISSMYIF